MEVDVRFPGWVSGCSNISLDITTTISQLKTADIPVLTRLYTVAQTKLDGQHCCHPLRSIQALGLHNVSAGLGWAKPWLLVAGQVTGLNDTVSSDVLRQRVEVADLAPPDLGDSLSDALTKVPIFAFLGKDVGTLIDDDRLQLPELDIQPCFELSLLDILNFHLLDSKDSCTDKVPAAAYPERRRVKPLLSYISTETTVGVAINDVTEDGIEFEVQKPDLTQGKDRCLADILQSYENNPQRVLSSREFTHGESSTKSPRASIVTEALARKRCSVRKAAKKSRFASFFQSDAYRGAEYVGLFGNSSLDAPKSQNTLHARQNTPKGTKVSRFAALFNKSNEYRAGAQVNLENGSGMSYFNNLTAQDHRARPIIATNQTPLPKIQIACKWADRIVGGADEHNVQRNFFNSPALALNVVQDEKEVSSISSCSVSCGRRLCHTPNPDILESQNHIINDEIQWITDSCTDEQGREAVASETDETALFGDLHGNLQSENVRVTFLVEALLGGRRLQQLQGTAEYGFTNEKDNVTGVEINKGRRTEGSFLQPHTPANKVVVERSSRQVISSASERATMFRQPTPHVDRNKSSELRVCSSSDEVKKFKNEHVVFDQPWSPRRLKYKVFSPIPFNLALQTNHGTPEVSDDDGEFPLSAFDVDLTNIDDTIRYSPSFNNGVKPYFCRNPTLSTTGKNLYEQRARKLLQKHAVKLDDRSVSQILAEAAREAIDSNKNHDDSVDIANRGSDYYGALNTEQHRMITLAILESRWTTVERSSPPIVRAVVSHYPGDVDVEWLQPVMNQPKVYRPIYVQRAISKWQEEALAQETYFQGSLQMLSHENSPVNAPIHLPARAACISEVKTLYPMSMEELMMRTEESLVFPAADRILLDDERFRDAYFYDVNEFLY